jgi:FkbM family methyltransferase
MYTILRAGRRLVRNAINVMHVPGYKLGSVLLERAAVRQYFNNAYENFGPSFADAFNSVFDNSAILSSFEWRNTFAEKEFRLPVFPEMQRSWNNARVWRWAGNRAIRKFYEIYLKAKPQGVFFDIGANDGTHTYPFAASGYECICFEPQPDCVDYIRRTSALNQFHRVRVEHLAMGDSDTEQVVFYISKSSWYSSLMKENVEQFETASPIHTKVVTLDTFCAESRLVPTLIKIDVEGCEWRVIQGGRKVFESVRPNLFAEISSDVVTIQKCWDFFTALDYKLYNVQHYTNQPFSLMHSTDDCIRYIGKGRNGDFIILSDPQVIKELEEINLMSH